MAETLTKLDDWTLVSERLPDTDYGWFDATVINWCGNTSVWVVRYSQCVNGEYHWVLDGGWNAKNDKFIDDRVIAWKPRPEPYRSCPESLKWPCISTERRV